MRAIENLTRRDSRKFTAICSDLLSQGFRVRFRANGKSMQPNIVENDALLVAPASLASLASLRRGDVVLTQDDLGLKAHRLVQKNILTDELLTRGDTGQDNDAPVPTALGKVIAVERGGHTRSTVGVRSRLAAKSNSVLYRAKLAFWKRTARVIRYLFPGALLLILSLLSNVSPATAQTADLSVTESAAPSTVSPGGTISYTIAVKNNSFLNTSTAPSWVQATPANTTYQSVAAPAGWTCTNPAVGGTGNVTCSATTLATNTTKTFTMVVAVNAGTAGNTTISSSVTVSATNNSNSGNDTATATVTVLSADLAIAETPGSGSASPGGTISYTVLVTNNGASAAAAPSWTQLTPTNTTFASVTPPAGWTCVKPGVGATGAVTCTDGSALANAGTASFTLVVTVNAGVAGGTVISGSTTVSSATFDPSAANNTATGSVTVLAADLAITQTRSPASVNPGGTISYTSVVTNNGPSSANAPVFTQATPANTTFQSVTPAAGWTCTNPAVGGTGTITCTDAANLANAGTATFIVNVVVNAGVSDGSTISGFCKYRLDHQ